MRIVKLDLASEGVLSELGKIKSNERGKLIDLELVDVSQEFDVRETRNFSEPHKVQCRSEGLSDFGERNIVLGNEKMFLESLGKFGRYCSGARKIPSLIIFSRKFDIGTFEKIIDFGVSKENALLVGAENLSGEDISFLAENRIRKVSLNLFLEDIADACDVVMEFASGKELFLMFDFSVIEDFELGGISALQASYILSRMGLMKNLSIAYFSGIRENSGKICAKLMSEVM